MSDKPLTRKFNGHLGQLDPKQEQTFAAFKEILQKTQLYTPATDSSKASHDDATLLRFLRARRFDIPKAQKQFSEWLAWRKKYDVDNLFANFPEDEFENSRRFYPMWTGRRDKAGLPVYVYKVGALASHIQEEINAVPPRRRYERIIVLYEAMTRFAGELCTYLPHSIEPVPISAVTAIIDLEGCSLRQLWALRGHLQEASTLAQANYPETMGTVIVVNASAAFPTIWGWVKGWFDEVTRDKIHILGKNPGNSAMLSSILDKEDLPKMYGGELEWEFFDPPALDDEAKQVLGEMPKGPWIFEDGKVKRPKEYKGSDKGNEVDGESKGTEASVTTKVPEEQPKHEGKADEKVVGTSPPTPEQRELNEEQPGREASVAEAAKDVSLGDNSNVVQSEVNDVDQDSSDKHSSGSSTLHDDEGIPGVQPEEDGKPAEVAQSEGKLSQMLSLLTVTEEEKSDPITSVFPS